MSVGNVPVNDGTIYYEERGSGIPLVLIHAGYLDCRMWDNQMETFSRDYRAIRYDVRGYGKSSKARGKYSDADDLKQLLDHLGIDKAILVGVSNGGRILLDFAVEYPHRVSAIVPVDFGISGYKTSGPDEDKLLEMFPELEEKQRKFLEEGNMEEVAAIDVDLWTPALSKDVRKFVLQIAIENAHVFMEDPWKYQVSPEPPAFERLDKLSMPVLMILGDRDLPAIAFLVKRIHDLVPHSNLVIIDGADHIPSLSKPEKFNEVVGQFLRNLR